MKTENRPANWSGSPPLIGLGLCSALTLVSASRVLSGEYMPLEEAGRLCVATLATLAAHLQHLDQVFNGAVMPGVLIVAASSIAVSFAIVRQVVRSHALVSSLLCNEIGERPAKLAQAVVKAGLKTRIRLISSGQFYCFCYGWLRPQVCLSTLVVNELSTSELEAVLRHEAWHVRRRDPLRILLVGSATSIVALARPLTRSMRIEQELAADAVAVREMGDKLPLAAALLKAIQASATPPPVLEPGAFGALDARIDQLVHEQEERSRPRAYRVRVLVSAAQGIALFALICLLMTATSAASGAVCLDC